MDSQGIEPRTFRMQSEHYTPKPQAHVIVMVTESMIYNPHIYQMHTVMNWDRHLIPSFNVAELTCKKART